MPEIQNDACCSDTASATLKGWKYTYLCSWMCFQDLGGEGILVTRLESVWEPQDDRQHLQDRDGRETEWAE